MATLMHTNKYTATLSEPVVTSQSVDHLNFVVNTDKATYAPEGKGKIEVKAEGSEPAGPKMSWTVTADEGLDVTAKGADLTFQVKKDVKKSELLAHVKISFDGAKGKVDLDIPCVVVIAAEKK